MILYLIYKLPRYFLPSFESIGLSVQEKRKNRFSRWRPFWTSDWNDFRYFWSASHPDTSYQVSSQHAFWFRRRFSWWPPGLTSWISDQNDLSYFWSTSCHVKLLLIYKLPWYFIPSFKCIGILVQKKRKIDFQHGPSRPNGVMSSVVSLPSHTFTEQASSKQLTSIVHILSPETDNFPSWISRKESMTVGNISRSNLHKKMLSNPQPPHHQSDAYPSEPPRPATSRSPVGCISIWATKASTTD